MSGAVRAVGWFLALSYGVGAPLAAAFEIGGHVLSDRFGYPPALILAVCGVQFVCAAAVLVPRLAASAALGLSVTTLGAIASHIRIGSPLTAVPAVLFTVLQAWYGITVWKKRPPPG